MKNFNVTGMSCAACQARVEKAVSAVTGVVSCSVNLLMNRMTVEGTAEDREIIRAVMKAGYGASVCDCAAGDRAEQNTLESSLEDRETPTLRRRLLSSLLFLALLMYLSMGHMTFGFPLPTWLEGNPIAIGLLQMILASVVMVIDRKFFVSGYSSVRHGAPTMDTLVALGSSSSFLWSVYALFRMTDAQVSGGVNAAKAWMGEFYFESAAMIVTLITVGKLLEARSKGKTTDALKTLMKLSPDEATVVRDGAETRVPVGEVKKGDVFLVLPGESIPADGVVLEGITAVDESALTGESVPVEKSPGDAVTAATVNRSGFIRCEATRVGENTAIARIIRMVSDAAGSKAPIARIADKVSGVFVPVVLAIALITWIVWLLIGKPFEFALARAISVLVISCPCALGLATPVAIMAGSGVGAKNGVLFKTAAALEETGRVRIVALDKTGTITLGEPSVTDVIPAEGVSEQQLLTFAGALEKRSEHPLGRAVLRECERRLAEIPEVTGFRILPGSGLTAVLDGKALTGGSLRYVKEKIGLTESLLKKAEELAAEGKTPLLFAEDGQAVGVIATSDTLRSGSRDAIRALKKLGISVVMLTGDDPRAARAVAKEVGVDYVISEVLPGDKEAVIRKLKQLGKTAMVGDGINDAPALTAADMGIAIGAGTDVAIDAADVVLMNSDPTDIPAAIRLSRRTLRNIHENLFWAFFYNVIGIPLAAGCWIGLMGWSMHPMIGAAAMSLSSFCVVSNALRLNLLDPRIGKNDRSPGNCVKPEALKQLIDGIGAERKTRIRTIRVEGMMCSHCEATVRKALEALEGVAAASVSHESGTAVVTLSGAVPDETLREAIEKEDYEVLKID